MATITGYSQAKTDSLLALKANQGDLLAVQSTAASNTSNIAANGAAITTLQSSVAKNTSDITALKSASSSGGSGLSADPDGVPTLS